MSTAIKLIDAVPVHLSPEEHSVLIRSTPASFNDIPPTLRYKEDNVSVTIVPDLPGFSDQDSINGSLYVLESVLVFMSETGRGFQIEYPSITLHAVSRTSDIGPAVYCQLDETVGGVVQLDTDDDTIRELCILPQNTSALEPIFEALSSCASLHPDAVVSEDNLDDAFVSTEDDAIPFFTGDEGEELSEIGRAALAHLESVFDHAKPQSFPNNTK